VKVRGAIVSEALAFRSGRGGKCRIYRYKSPENGLKWPNIPIFDPIRSTHPPAPPVSGGVRSI
jgi:hypothetical protein